MGVGDGVGASAGVISFVMLENISDSALIAVIWASPIFEKGALGAGLLRAFANSNAAIVAFSAEEL